MSTIEQALKERLESYAPITSITNARIFPLAAPQDIKKPFVVYQRISSSRVKNSRGPSYVAQPRFQIDCYSSNYENVKNLAEAIRKALDGWRDYGAAVVVKGCSLINDREFWEASTDPKLYRISMDFIITHDEDRPLPITFDSMIISMDNTVITMDQDF